MNIAAMAVVTLLVFAEKTLPVGTSIARAAGIALAIYGMTVLIFPQALPTFMAAGEMDMN
jgi:predicted metal-binding membrane protein